MALGLILASLDQAFQLVGVLRESGLQALTGFVLLNELADGLTGCCGETGHLVGGHLRIWGSHDVGLANRGHVPDAVRGVGTAERRRLGGSAPLLRQQGRMIAVRNECAAMLSGYQSRRSSSRSA